MPAGAGRRYKNGIRKICMRPLRLCLWSPTGRSGRRNRSRHPLWRASRRLDMSHLRAGQGSIRKDLNIALLFAATPHTLAKRKAAKRRLWIIKTAARIELRTWKIGCLAAVFSSLPPGRQTYFYWLLFRPSQINRNENKHDSECDKDYRPPLLLSAGNPDCNKQYPQQHWRNHRKKSHFIYSFQDGLLYHDDWLCPNHELQ